jgi:DNA polymerase-3 subunit delta'
MIQFEDVVLQNSQFLELTKGDLNANSFLFFSPDEVFLSSFSLCFAKFLLCTGSKKPCGHCSNCTKMEANTHADVTIYPKNNKNVLVDDVKDMIENIYLTPFDSDKKIFIFNSFSSANVQAQNKLLKILEEPPKNSFIILNVTNDSKILPTVASRCKKVRLAPLSDEEIRLAFKNEDKDKVENILDVAQGSLETSTLFLSKENFSGIVSACIDTICNMKDSRQMLLYSQKLLKEKENFGFILDVFEELYRDILLVKLHKTELVKNKHHLSEFEMVEDEYDCDAVDKILRKIFEIRKEREANCNPELLVDSLLLYILEVKYLCRK